MAEHVGLLTQRHHAVKMCDYKDGGRQSHQRTDQHAPPQGAIEHLLAHQQGQLEQQSIRPEK